MLFSLKPTIVGLGDQILQHDMIFRMAAALGASYVHEPMQTRRLFEDVGSFTGIDLFPRKHDDEDLKGLAVREVELHEFVSQDGRLVVPKGVATLGVRTRILFRYLGWQGQGSSIYREIAGVATFPFRDLYSLSLRQRASVNPSIGRLRIVLHVRLGDTVTLQLSDGRTLTVDGMRILGSDPGIVVRPPIDVKAVVALARTLADRSEAEVVLLSDGYDRAIDNLRTYYKRVPDLTIAERDRLIELLRQRAEDFRDSAPAIARIGETVADTKFAIDTIASSDIVVRSSGSFATSIARFIAGLPHHRILDLASVLHNPDSIWAAYYK